MAAKNSQRLAKIYKLNTDLEREGTDFISIMYNPFEYSIEKGNNFSNTNLPGLQNPITQFSGGNATTLSMELFFDTHAPYKDSGVTAGEDVRTYTDQIDSLLVIDNDLKAPPVVEIEWGGSLFKGVLTKLSKKFTMFNSIGVPVRATLNVSFSEFAAQELFKKKEIKDPILPKEEKEDTNKYYTVVKGDTLWAIAAREYKNPIKWRVIADANGVNDPKKLKIGKKLIIPEL